MLIAVLQFTPCVHHVVWRHYFPPCEHCNSALFCMYTAAILPRACNTTSQVPLAHQSHHTTLSFVHVSVVSFVVSFVISFPFTVPSFSFPLVRHVPSALAPSVPAFAVTALVHCVPAIALVHFPPAFALVHGPSTFAFLSFSRTWDRLRGSTGRRCRVRTRGDSTCWCIRRTCNWACGRVRRRSRRGSDFVRRKTGGLESG